MGKLADTIREIIYEEVPINCTCNSCEVENDINTILPPYRDTNAFDRKSWDRLVAHILETIADTPVLELAREIVDAQRAAK